MAIGINDLDDDDFGMGFTPSNLNSQDQEDPANQDPNPNDEGGNQLEDDFLSDYLKTKGIEDPSKIKFADENDQLIERSWDDLSREEKFNILNTPLEQPRDNENENDLTEEEIQLLNLIRQSNLTPSEYLNQISGAPQEPQYQVDDFTDDQLFLLDLESRVGEISDEMGAQALATAKQNEELFKKQVEGIRKEYKEREDYQLQQQQAELEQQQEEAYNQFQDNIIDSIEQFDSIGNLNLNFDNSDKEELAQFMLSRDEAGNNYLWQALQDPDTLVKAAWFILNGEEALNGVAEYFKNQIKLISENQYKKGFEEGKNGKTPSRPQVVINQKQNNHPRQYNNINDLDDDD